MSSADSAIRFLLNGKTVTLDSVCPTRTVLQFLREDQRCTGTKEGCAEGDCGACTVVVGELKNGELALKTVNSCIQLVPTLDCKALFTVEYLRQQSGDLHPVQQAMVDCHGSQCGFCTPGFVMSLWGVYLNYETRVDSAEIRSALTGNLCRCTGYKPILDAGKKMFDAPRVELNREALREQLQALQRSETLIYEHKGARFHAPRTLAELSRLRADLPNATILAGCTDIGLWVNKQFRELVDIIYIGEVSELNTILVSDQGIRIGAAVSLSDAASKLIKHYPQTSEMWERFASRPIRNAGTLGGNVANGSPIGDAMPHLIALGAQVVLNSVQGERTLAMEDFYLDYMKKDLRGNEIVEAVLVPMPGGAQIFRTYKVSKRFDSDISAVCAAFSIELEEEKITLARVAFGGMAATPKRAVACEQVIIGSDWNEETAFAAMNALAQDYQPLSDMRASADNRMQTAQNLLYRFWLETRSDKPLSTAQSSVFASKQANS